MTSNNIKVCIKIRPLIQREKNDNLPSLWSLVDDNTIKSDNKQYKLSFDHIFDETRTTEDIFNTVGKQIVANAVNGINGTIFAYGQTSSGKTYCMMGTDKDPGIIPRTVNEIFKQIEMVHDREFLIRVGYIEIYNEKIFDLLVENKPEITKIRENSNGEIYINQTELVSSSPQTILESYAKGSNIKIIGETNMNERSSRSHTIFRIVIESHESGNDGVFQVSTLNLVDLAGSERADQTKATGERLREGGHINKSLMSLSKVIRELSDLNDDKGKNVDGIKYINYRDSKLTRILSASLGGNAMTAIICTITPAALDETYSTLTFASNAKKIKNQPKVNETVSDKVIMTRLQKEIAMLKDELRVEKSKKSEVSKIEQLIAQIFDRESQIIHSHMSSKTVDRRRTWCPSSKMEKIVEESFGETRNLMAPPPPFVLMQAAISPNPDNFLQTDDFLSNEIFVSPSKMEFDNPIMMSPVKRHFNDFLPNHLRTPRSLKSTNIEDVDSPHVGKPKTIEHENKILKARLEYLEGELEELQYFKALEEKFSAPSDDDIKILNENIKTLQTQLEQRQEKIEILENDLTKKLIELESVKELKEKCELMETECKKAKQEQKTAENLLASIEYEHEQLKNKFKNRETELIQSLDEARSGSSDLIVQQKEKIRNLEELLKKTEENLFSLEKQKEEQSVNLSNISEMEKTIKDLESKLEIAINSQDSSERNLKEKNKEFETVSEQLLEAVQETENLQNTLNKLEEEMKSKSNDFTVKFSELEALILSKDTEKENLLVQIAESSVYSSQLQKIKVLLESEEFPLIDDENNETCKLIIKLRQDLIQAKHTAFEKSNVDHISIENLEKKISVLEESLKETDVEREKLKLKLCEEEQLASQFRKIEEMLKNEETNGMRENMSVSEIISQLCQSGHRVKHLEIEKESLLSQISEQNSANENTEILNQRINELNNVIQSKEIEKNDLLARLLEREKTADQLQKIYGLLASNELSFGDELTDNDEVIKMLVQKIAKIETLETENVKLLNDIKDIQQTTAKESEEFERQANDLKESITSKDNEISKLNNELSNHQQKLERYERLQEVVSNNIENISEEYFEDEFGRFVFKLHQTANRTETLENEKVQLLTEITDIKHAAEILTEKLLANQTLSETEFQLREKIESLEMELINTKKELYINIQNNSEYESIQLNLKNKIEDIRTKENEGFASKITHIIAEYDSKIEEFEKQHEDNSSKIIAYENEISQLMSKLDEFKEQNENLVKLTSNCDEDKRFIELTEQLEDFERRHAKLSTDFENIQSQYTQLVEKTADYDDIKSKITEIIEDYEKIKSQNEKLKLDLENIDSQYTELIEKTADYEDIKSKNAELTADYEKIKNQNEKITTDLENLQKQHTKIIENSADYEDIKSKSLELTTDYEKIKDQNKKLTSNLENIQIEYTKLVEKTIDYEDIKSKSAVLTADYEKIKSQNEKLSADIEIIRSQYAELVEKTIDYDDIKSKCAALTADFEKVKDQNQKLIELTEDFDEIKSQNAKFIEATADHANQLCKLDAELTNKTSQLLLMNEDFNSLNQEMEMIKVQLKTKSNECDELKTRYRRRSEDNERKFQELEMINNKLIQQVGASEALKTSVENDFKKLKDEHDHNLKEIKVLKEKSSDNDMKYAILDVKYNQLQSANMELENKLKEINNKDSKKNDFVKKLQKEIIELNEKLDQKMSDNDSKNQLLAELHAKCEKLIKEVEDNKPIPRKSSSPSHNRRSDEKELFSAQHRHSPSQLTPARTLKSNIDRKSRRQSTYDERRDLSAWELVSTESTQTDPVDNLCACIDLAEKIKELQIEIRLRDCKIANAQRMANVNMYKYELEDSKKECQQEKYEKGQLKELVESLKGKLRSIMIKNQELELNQKCHDIKDHCIQTDNQNIVSGHEYEKLLTEKNLLEKRLVEAKKQLDQEKLLSEKENMTSNKLKDYPSSDSGISNGANNRQEYEILENEHKKLQKKYDVARRLCNLRLDDINKLNKELSDKTEQVEKINYKYQHAKTILDMRLDKIKNLREQLGIKATDDTRETTND